MEGFIVEQGKEFEAIPGRWPEQGKQMTLRAENKDRYGFEYMRGLERLLAWEPPQLRNTAGRRSRASGTLVTLAELLNG